MVKYKEKFDGFYMIEPFLKGYNGHLFNYTKSLSDELAGSDINFKVFVSTDCEKAIGEEIQTDIVFDRIPGDKIFNSLLGKLLFSVIKFNTHLYKGLNKITLKEELASKIIFFGTIQHIHMLGLAVWLIFNDRKRLPAKIILTLRLSIFRYDLKRWSLPYYWYRLCFWLIHVLRNKSEIIFISDSQKLIDEFSRVTGMKIFLLPIPHTSNHYLIDQDNLFNQDDRIIFTSLGSARKNKGYDVLVDAIIEMSKFEIFHRIEFILQSNCNQDDIYIKNKIREIKKYDFPNVKILEKELNENEYYALLVNSDVILIPYDQAVYYANTSGILTEAISNSKPVIVTENTWMSDNLKHGAGISFNDKNHKDLAEKIVYVHENFRKLKSEAEKKSKSWINFHSSPNFMKVLLDICNK